MTKRPEKKPGDLPEKERKPRVPRPSDWSSTMDELVEEAMRSGLFDDLPGRGKPLDLSKNPYAADKELAYKLLKDNDYTLPWITERTEIEAAIDAFRTALRRAWLRHYGEYRVAESETIRAALTFGWRRSLEQLQEEIGELNRRITNANLKIPGEQLEILKLSLERELERAGASQDLGSHSR